MEETYECEYCHKVVKIGEDQGPYEIEEDGDPACQDCMESAQARYEMLNE